MSKPIAIALLAPAIAPIAALAQITPDGTLGGENSTVTEGAIVQGDLADLIEGGAIRGGNLFHSFLEFNINQGQRVYFANPAAIENILSRVTGDNPSNIFGILGVTGTADLFLLNPNGIVFGPSATLDVGGSFAATTASGVQFGEVGTFSATDPELPVSILTIAPSAFFFNQVEPAAITNESRARRSGLDPSGQFAPFGLRVPDGENLLLLGGDVNVNAGGIAAFGGRIDIGGLAREGVVNLKFENGTPSLEFPEGQSLSDVSLTNDAGLTVRVDGSGEVIIHAEYLSLSDSSSIQAGVSSGFVIANSLFGDISLTATENITLTDGSSVSNSIEDGAQGNSGKIRLNAGNSITVDDSFLFSNVWQGGEGNTDGITIDANSLFVIDSGQIQSEVEGTGNAGDVIISVTGEVLFDGKEDLPNGRFFPSGVFTGIETTGTGNGGNLEIIARSLSITDRAQLSSNTQGNGNAGNISIKTQDSVFLENATIITEVTEGLGNGNGGNILIETRVLELSNGSVLLADTENLGNAGNITIKAAERLTLIGRGLGQSGIIPSQISSTVEGAVGKGGNIDISAGNLDVRDGGFISTGTFGTGNAGNITISINFLNLLEGSQIIASTSGVGNSGIISIDAKSTIALQGTGALNFPSGVFSAVNEGATGNSQGIEIEAGALSILDRAQLVSSTEGNGNAGDIAINVRENVSLNNSIIITEVTEGLGNGNGGNISIRANRLDLANGSSLLADTENIGNAGSIFISASERVSLYGQGPGASNPEQIVPSQITTTVEEQAIGSSGLIDIFTNSLTLTDSAFMRTSTFGQGPAGNMNIRVGSLSASGGAEIATLTSSSAPAGDLTITATNEVLLSGQSDSGPTEVTSASRGGAAGDGGDTFITSPLIRITDGARLSAVSEGGGAAGSVNLDVARLEIFDGSIETNAAQSTGGDIRVNDFGGEPSGIVILRGDGDITTDSFGDGGNITLNSIVVAFDDSDILARSEDARGGNIALGPFFSETLPIGALSPTEDNDRVDISADGRLASGTISTPDVSFVENNLNELSGEIVDTATLTAGSCIARTDDTEGSFIVTGGEGLPQQPGNDTVSAYPTGAVQATPDITAQPAIQEPQSVYRLADGRLVLSHECD